MTRPLTARRPATPLAAALVAAAVVTVTACSGTTTAPPAGAGATAAPAAPAAGGTTAPARRGAPGTVPGTVPPVGAGGPQHAWQRNAVGPISPAYRQGVARDGDDWLWSFNTALFRTVGDDLRETVQKAHAIPPDLEAKGYNHIGDIDVDPATGLLWVPLEKEDKADGIQRMAAYDAKTFDFKGSFEVRQHHASFVAIDSANRVAYSQDQFGGDTILAYRMPPAGAADPVAPWTPLPPIQQDHYVDKVQGVDIDTTSGTFYLATDDDHDGVYALDPATGRVEEVGRLSVPAAEGEGIDVTWIPAGPFRGLLHVMSVGGVQPGRFEHFSDNEG